MTWSTTEVHARSSISSAQYASYEVEFAILLKILNFVEWSNPPSTDDFPRKTTIALVGTDDFTKSIHELVEALEVPNVSLLSIKEIPSPDIVSKISVLYIKDLDDPKSTLAIQMIEQTIGLPILTVGSGENFLKKGGMIRFMKKNERMAFEVDLKQSKKAGISFRAQLLRLANKIVK